MFTISKTESTLAVPSINGKQEYHTFQFSGVLVHSQNLEDFTAGAESVLEKRNYHLLPGETSVMRSFYNGSDFIIVIQIGQVTSLIYCPGLHWYKIFMKEYGSCASVWHLVAPFPRETKPNPANYTKFDPRRGY